MSDIETVIRWVREVGMNGPASARPLSVPPAVGLAVMRLEGPESRDVFTAIRELEQALREFASERPGTHLGIAAGLDAYHARNLVEALKLVPDTGDWHGSLRAACHIVLDREGEKYPRPNRTADEMKELL